MDWLRSGLAAASKHAQETAAQAQAMAFQASERAKELAGPALERAKAIAAVAAEEAQTKLQELTRAQGGEASTSDPEELYKYGVTDALKEYVGSLTYTTFSDFPVAALEGSQPLGPLAQPSSSPGGFRLSPWQERHAMLALQNLPQLTHLRFALIPKRMHEEHFWITYFTLAKHFLPPEAFGAPPAPAAASSTSPSSASAFAGAAVATSVPEATSSKAAASRGEVLSPTDSVSEVFTPMTAGASASFPATPLDGVDDAELVEHLSDDDGHDLDKLDDDPELAAYLQEALDVDDGGSDAESGGEDLDEYLNQLDAELNDGDDDFEDDEDNNGGVKDG